MYVHTLPPYLYLDLQSHFSPFFFTSYILNSSSLIHPPPCFCFLFSFTFALLFCFPSKVLESCPAPLQLRRPHFPHCWFTQKTPHTRSLSLFLHIHTTGTICFQLVFCLQVFSDTYVCVIQSSEWTVEKENKLDFPFAKTEYLFFFKLVARGWLILLLFHLFFPSFFFLYSSCTSN